MPTAVAELGRSLESMLALDPPGMTPHMVDMITQLCTANVHVEPNLIEKIFTHFKTAPSSHKLGVLYVIDSITLHWVDATRRAGRPPRSAAPGGTLAAGVDRMTKLLPVLMTDIISTAPLDDKEKIGRLIDTWEYQGSVPPSMLMSFRRKLNTSLRKSPQALHFNRPGAPSSPQAVDGPSMAAKENNQPSKPVTNVEEENTATSDKPPATLPITGGSIDPGSIKVLGRTIVVDGLFSEPQLHSLFLRFGRVQTFANFNNYRAVVKMRSHRDAVSALDGIASFSSFCLRGIRSIRWGVGFGSRDYMDVSTGTSIIPIGHLADVERRWLLKAKHGGTRGLPIQSGMVIEEPDTDICAGVSSPAIIRFISAASGDSVGRFANHRGVGDRYQRPSRGLLALDISDQRFGSLNL